MMDIVGGGWVDLLQATVERLGAVFVGEGLQFCPQRLVWRDFRDRPAFDHRGNVLAGATDQQGEFATTLNVINGGICQLLILGQTKIFVGIDYVNQVMGNLSLLLWCGFGGADVHVAINLTAVCADDFTIEGFRKGNCQGCFAGGGGAEDDQ